VQSAREMVKVLTPDHVIMDAASTSPRLKVEVASILAPCGAAFADGSIVGPSSDVYARQIVASGPAAARVGDALNPWGMRIKVVSDKVGAASAIKILRSVVMKGLEALVVECLLGARRYGIDREVVQSLESNFSRSFLKLADSLAGGDVIHAGRRADETDMSADTLADIGIDPLVTRAVAARLRWVAELGTSGYFKGVRPSDYGTALDGIERRLSQVQSAGG
jgi:3-hydroxyisobutyrate dehydrogenase-like beta-hydroxyacid dehydrogenase